MIRKLPFAFILCSTFLSADDSCTMFQSEAEVGFEQSNFTGSIQAGEEGSTLDMKKDLGISKSKKGLKAMLSRSTTHHKFGFKLEKYEHSGSHKLSQDILFNGAQYATSTLINSQLSLKWAKLKYRYRFTPAFSVGTDINALRFKAMVNDNETKKTIVLPSLGIEYDKELEEGLRFIAKTSSTLTGDSRYLYGYMGVSYDLKVIDCTSLHMGYQYKKLEINADDIHANMEYKGLYAGLAMKF